MKKSKKVTLQVVADQAEVSVSTASRALKGSKGISSAVQTKIRDIAEELGYLGTGKPDVDITILSNMNMSEVGHVEFLNGIMDGVKAECKLFSITPSVTLLSPGQKLSDLPFLKKDKQACLVLSFQDNELFDLLLDNDIPTFVINGFDPRMRLSSVAPANFIGGQLAAEHLISQGHQRILHLTYTDRATICQRLAGFRKGMEVAGLDMQDDLVVNLESMRTDVGYSAMKDYLTKNKKLKFTAVQCCNDSVALGAMAAAVESGYRIPEDISFIGFDDISNAAIASPPLTTIGVEREQMGVWAVRQLLDQVRSADAWKMHTEFGVSLIERNSIKKLNA